MASIRYKLFIEQMDLRETLDSILVHDDASICTSVLHFISITLDFYSSAIESLFLPGEVEVMGPLRHPSLFRRFLTLSNGHDSIVSLLRSDLSSDIYGIPTSKCHRKHDANDNQDHKHRIFNSIIEVVKLMTSRLHYFTMPSFRHALWRCLSKCLLLSDNESLQNLLSLSLPSHGENAQPTFTWLLRTCFRDDNESLRKYGAYRIGKLLFFDKGEKLKAQLFQSTLPTIFNMDGLQTLSPSELEISQQFMAQCDYWTNGFVYSTSDRNRTSISNEIPSYYVNDVIRESYFSYMKTALMMFSSLSQFVQPDSDLGVSLLIESVLRIVRFFLRPLLNTPDKSSNNGSMAMPISMDSLISSLAMEELHYLGEDFHLWTKLLENGEDMATPLLFCEFMSHAKTEERRSSHRLYRSLFYFIKSFLSRSTKKLSGCANQDDVDDDALDYTDKILPTVVSSLVVNQDYEILLACTGFRWSLARYVTAASKNRVRHFTSEYIIGMVFRHQIYRDNLTNSFSREELMRQTSLLCCSDINSLKIIGRLLSRYESVCIISYLSVVATSNF